MLKRAKDQRKLTDFGNGHQSALSGNVPLSQSPREWAAVNDTAEIALWYGNVNVAPQWSVCMFGSRRLEQNAIKVIPAGAFSPYKKLRRMWVDEEIHVLCTLSTIHKNFCFHPVFVDLRVKLYMSLSPSLTLWLWLYASLSLVSFFLWICSSQRLE